jgi:succinoglycan biosynthesis protein ExoW
MNKKVAVVIPFYQRQAGVLSRSVASVLRQRTISPTIIVSDDGSPVSGKSELAAFLPAYSQQIHLVERKNGGAAAARKELPRNQCCDFMMSPPTAQSCV